MELITTDTIINYLQEQVEKKIPIDSNTFLDASQKLNILLGDEQEKLFGLQQECAKMRGEYILNGKSVATAKVLVEATDDYREMLTQKAKIDRIIEFIRIAKIQARISNENFKSY